MPLHPIAASAALLAAEHSSEVLLTLDPTGVLLAVNPAACAELHADAAQLIGRPLVDLLDQGSRPKGAAMLQAAAAGPTTLYELNHVTGDGTISMVGYRAIPLPAVGQSPRGILLIGRTLAGTVASTERLLGLNRRLNALFAIASVASRSLDLAELLREVLALALAELDAQAGAVLLIDAPVRLERSQDAQIAALSLHVAAQQGFDPAFVARMAEPGAFPARVPGALDQAQPLTISGSAEELGLAPGDLLAPVGPLLNLAAVPLRGEDRLLGWLYAISDRYRAFGPAELGLIGSIADVLGAPVVNARLYGALRETSGQLSAVLDSIDSGVLLVDAAGMIRYANARLGALLATDVHAWGGQPRAELLGHILAPAERTASFSEGQLWTVAGAPGRILRRFTGQVADTAGARSGTIEVYSDVTQIYEMDQIKDEFVAAAAHDLKTPVTTVKGYTQIALRLARRLDEQRLIQQLEMINARTDDLAHLMDTLLDMSRLQSGRLRLEISDVRLDSLISRVARHFDFDLQRRGRALTLDLPVAPIEVAWDEPRIERVLINLIGNALKYSPEGGEVALRVRIRPTPTDEQIELAVTDHGIGIAPAERLRIFERFYRARQTIATGFKGSGLGLYICWSVVTAHGGRIWADDALHGGRGITIHVILPRRVAADEYDHS
jgi:two-component system phosphate regulon sensor histidine kinase PhoR